MMQKYDMTRELEWDTLNTNIKPNKGYTIFYQFLACDLSLMQHYLIVWWALKYENKFLFIEVGKSYGA